MHRSAYALVHHDELAGSLMDQQLFSGYNYVWNQPFDPNVAAAFEHEAMPNLHLDPNQFRSSFTPDQLGDPYCTPTSIQPRHLDSPHSSNVAVDQRALMAAQWSAAHAHGRMGSPVETVSSSRTSSSLHAQSRTMSIDTLGMQSYDPTNGFQVLDNTVDFFQEPEPMVILPSQYAGVAPHSPVASKSDARPVEIATVSASQMESEEGQVDKEASSDESEPAWPQQDKSDADSDYTPARSLVSKKRSHGGRSRGPPTARVRNKVIKRAPARQPQLRAAHVGVFAGESNATSRPDVDYECRSFTCPSRPYGCYTTFTSKNEWKRHFISQHLCLGYWRCDLCPTVKDKCPNDFNRKDLFTQHLRRMHSPSATMGAGSPSPGKSTSRRSKGRSKTTPEDSEFAREIEQIRKRCWVQARQPPTELECAFCSQPFTGDGTCLEEFLEHVGRHLVVVPSDERSAHDDEVQHQANSMTFAKDVHMRDWLVRNGLLSRTEGRWELCNPLTTDMPTIKPFWGSADAEGDPE